MNYNTVKHQLHLYLKGGKINFFELQQILRQIDGTKLYKDLSKPEKDLVLSFINRR